MEAKRVLVHDGGEAVISCPFCRKTKRVSVARVREQKKRDLRIRCSCKNIFGLCLEYRRQPRKPVKLLGKCINLSRNRERQDVIIRDISAGGIGFYTFGKHRTQNEDLIQVFFNLNDINQTAIDAKVAVRSVNNSYVGCEFINRQNFKTSLGFYLLG